MKIKNNPPPAQSDRPQAGAPADPKLYCRSFEELKNWQVAQYQSAVDENKWYMSERSGYEIDWRSAEKDFVDHEYYGCAEKWREKYCMVLCPYYASCALGQLLNGIDPEEQTGD